jgi:hypothetical protein
MENTDRQTMSQGASMLVRKCLYCAGGAIEKLQPHDSHTTMCVRIHRRVVPKDVLLFGALAILVTGTMMLCGLFVAFIDDRTFHINWWAALSGLQLLLSILWLTATRLHWISMDPWVRASMWLSCVMMCAGAITNMLGALFWAIWTLDTQQMVVGTTSTLLLNSITVPMLLMRLAWSWKRQRQIEMDWKKQGNPYHNNIIPWWG